MAISLAPSSGSTAGQTTVVISGTNLSNASSVRFGLNTATITANTATTVTVHSPAGAGAVPVTVTTPGGTSLPATFFYTPLPIITGINPACGSSAGGNTVVITGQNLGAATTVSFGATDVTGPFTPNTAGSVSVTAPAGTGAVAVSVATAGGTVDGLAYSYCAALAAGDIVLTPATGPTDGNNMISITDVNGGLACATGVSIGGSPAPFFVVSDTELDVIVPAGTGATAAVIVTTCAGATTATATYAYVAPPG